MLISSRRVAVWHIAVVVGRLAFLLTGWIEGLDRCIAQLNSTADPGGIVRGGGWCRLPTPLVGSCAVGRQREEVSSPTVHIARLPPVALTSAVLVVGPP